MTPNLAAMTAYARAWWRSSPAATRLAILALGAGFLLALSAEAEARVGGGQGFSSGRRSSGGGSSGGGGSGGDGEFLADILFLLIHLAIRYPAVGVPLLILFVAAVAVRFLFFSGDSRPRVYDADDGLASWEAEPSARPRASRRGKGSDAGISGLRAADGAFSVPVFLDFAGLVHRRALEAASRGAWDALTPFVGEGAREQLAAHFGGRDVRDVVIGATALERVTYNAKSGATARVTFDANYTLGDGADAAQLFVRSAWTFRRAPDALSLPPEAALALACPSCASPVDTDAMGACRSCGTPITAGQLQWQVSAVAVTHSEPVQAPELSFWDGGAEPSATMPTVQQPDLHVAMREFQGRHPDFDRKAFAERVSAVYHELQAAWSENRWERARPYVTDPLYQQLRFWIERYRKHGLRNQLTDVELRSQKIVKVEKDAWYDAITVRIHGSMKDATVDASGKVVGGSAKADRQFSEYWTFLRASGTGADTKPPGGCPSCGAPLDRIGAAGVCGYCDTKITTGNFDWVLSRIDQAEVYRG